MLALEPRPAGLRWHLSFSGRWQTGEIPSREPAGRPRLPSLPMGALEVVRRVGYVLQYGGAPFTRASTEITPAPPARLAAWLGEKAAFQGLVREGLRSLPTARHFILSETAFFDSLPDRARFYALPSPWREETPRFGFGGLTHARALRVSGSPARMVSIHLDDQPSVAALENGRAVDTSTGFSALDGLPSLTGSGAIDPSITIELLRQGWEPGRVRNLLERESGFRVFTPGAASLAEIAFKEEMPRRMLTDGLLKSCGSALAALGGADLITITYDGCPAWTPVIAALRERLSLLDTGAAVLMLTCTREEVLFETLESCL